MFEQDFSKSRVGDRVWGLRCGWGTISKIDRDGIDDYPIRVNFDRGRREIYTLNGHFMAGHLVPSLFHGPITITAPPQPKRTKKVKTERWFIVQPYAPAMDGVSWYQYDQPPQLSEQEIAAGSVVVGPVEFEIEIPE